MAQYRPVIAPNNSDLELVVIGQDTLHPDTLGTGSRNGRKYLRDDGVWANANEVVMTTSEALAAGDFINIWSSGGNFRVRKASATLAYQAHGFVLAAFTNGASATVYLSGNNTAVSSVTPGNLYISTVAGGWTATVPTGANVMVQNIGVGISATVIKFTPGEPLILAA